MKALEDENSRLKKIVADLTLDREMLHDVIMSSGESSEAGPKVQADRRDPGGLGHFDPTGLQSPAVRYIRRPRTLHLSRRGCRKTGYPKTIRVDNGSEFVSRALDLWA